MCAPLFALLTSGKELGPLLLVFLGLLVGPFFLEGFRGCFFVRFLRVLFVRHLFSLFCVFNIDYFVGDQAAGVAKLAFDFRDGFPAEQPIRTSITVEIDLIDLNR